MCIAGESARMPAAAQVDHIVQARVLLVEDDPKLGGILLRALADDGISADLANSGESEQSKWPPDSTTGPSSSM